MIEQAELLTRYQRLRKITSRLANHIVNAAPRQAMFDAAKRLGFWHRGTVSLQDEDEMAVLMDYCLYDHRIQGVRVIDAFLAKTPPVDADDRHVLEGMCEAQHSLFIVNSIEPGIGLHLRDLLHDTEVFMVDINFSRSVHEDTAMASRLLTIDGVAFSTGATLPLGVILPAGRQDFIEGFADKFKAKAQACASGQDYSEVTALLIRTCLAAGATARVHYVNAGEKVDEARASMKDNHARWRDHHRSPQRIGRNDPCTCGSGKKFKYCCGGRK